MPCRALRVWHDSLVCSCVTAPMPFAGLRSPAHASLYTWLSTGWNPAAHTSVVACGAAEAVSVHRGRVQRRQPVEPQLQVTLTRDCMRILLSLFRGESRRNGTAFATLSVRDIGPVKPFVLARSEDGRRERRLTGNSASGCEMHTFPLNFTIWATRTARRSSARTSSAGCTPACRRSTCSRGLPAT